MKKLIRGHAGFFGGAALISLLILTSFAGVLGQQAVLVSKPLTKQEKQTIAAFDKRIKLYLKQRARVKARLPKLSKDSTPEEIAANEKALMEGVRAARNGAKPGDLLTRDIAAHIRATLKEEFKGTDRKEIRKIVLEAETAGVPLRVNYPYPDTKEFVEMPATVLLKLPTLPKEVKFRYVGRNLFIVDSDNNLIVDYMIDALP
jgi:hypothetical protein